MRNRDIFILLKLAIISWFFFLGFMEYELFWPPTVYRLNRNPFPVLTKTIHAGDTIQYITDYCKYVGVGANITISLQRKVTDKEISQGIQDIIYIFETHRNANTPSGCHTITREQPIPPMIKPATYRIILNVDSQINQFRKFTSQDYSEWFQVE